MRLLKVATCSLNQWAMDFDWNINNIKESLCRAREAGAAIRLGPELEITGYGCEDHFFEQDTITHAWECLKELLVGDWTDGMLCSFGMPVARGPELYNCQVLCLNRKIVMIRPKMWLANGGGCSELRWFTAWQQKEPGLDDFLLPAHVSDALSQTTVPFGYGFVQFLDTAVAAEICKELFSPVPVHPELALNGVEVFMNPSGSVHLLEKMERRRRVITSAMSACGGVYMYSNHLGCDGGRVYYDGCSCIVVNGEVIAQGLQFSLKDVDLVVAQLDLDKVSSYRACDSTFGKQASCKRKVSSVFVPHKLCKSFNLQSSISIPTKIEASCREEEIGLGAACWLWNYLRRSGASGFLLPLSGGVESSAVAAIVACMCRLVVKEIANGGEQVKADAVRIGHYADGQFPADAKEFAKRIFSTVFMASQNRCDDSRRKSRMMAEEIGSWHLDLCIDGLLSALLSLFHTVTGKSLRNKEEGGTDVETSAVRSMRSRSRMVVAFMLASLLPWLHNRPPFYLVLTTTTADQGLSANFTKYGCSSGDINPVGSITKQDLRSFLKWAATNLGYSSLAQSEPTEELGLCPSRTSAVVGEGMREEEGWVYGRLRKTFLCGPVSMFENLCDKWGTKMRPGEIAGKVKRFMEEYAINRHKMTVLTPAYLVEGNSPEDNRFDLRPFLYNSRWPYQFRKIDELLQQQLDVDGDDEVVAGSINIDD